MTSYRHTPDMGEISGFGGGYEECCQDMLEAGVRWSVEHPTAEPRFKSNDAIFGIILEDNQDAKDLTEAVIAAAKGEATGAQHHAVIGRVLQIHRHGWDWYCAEIRKAEKAEKEGKS